MVHRVAQRFDEWGSASRTFSAMASLINVVWREVSTLLVLIFHLVHARSTSPACLLSVCQLQLLARRQGITTRRRLVRGDGAPCRPTLRWRVSISPGLNM